MTTTQLILALFAVIFVVEALTEIVFAGKPRPVHSKGRAYRMAFAALSLAMIAGYAAVVMPA